MTNQTPQPSRPPQDERQDELIAVLLALGAIGTIFFWGINRIGNGTQLASQLSVGPIAAEIDGDDSGLLLSGDLDEEGGASVDDGLLADLGLDSEDDDGDSVATGDGTGTTTGGNNSGIAAVGTAVGGSVLIDPAGADATESDDPEVAEAEDSSSAEEAVGSAEESDASEDTATEPEASDVADGSETDEPEIASQDLATDVPADAFSDVGEDYWATPFIEGLRQKDVVTGFVDGSFEPDAPVSRSQFAAQLSRANQKYDDFAKSISSTDFSYSDIPSSHPQYDAIGDASKTGFMSGYPEGDFRPNDKVSRLEVLIALASGLNLDVPSDPEGFLQEYYGDFDQIPDWAWPKIAAATQAGLVVNPDDLRSLKPSRSATRAEASAMLYQALVNLGEVEPVESDAIVTP